MIATVRLDDSLEKKLEELTKSLHKKKSDVIREAIDFYANSINDNKKSRLSKSIEKTKEADKNLYNDFEGTLSDSI